ncbi:MAG: hypothetical protein EPN37_04465 [Chitinophagaceae bacterium]|nr:MAG: hypothetical protein EPN37_04465 [Chitinophagaceae bacterium]
MASQKLSAKQISQYWDEFRDNIRNSTPVDKSETVAASKKRIRSLESDPESWFKYYFPNFSYAEPAVFHKRATRRIIDHAEWYEVRAWSRELAKSTRTMMEVLYLTMRGKKKNVLLVSNSKDNADELLMPYKTILESNQRIIHDYGTQENLGAWESGKFITKSNVSFRAIGAGQSPRGTKKNEARPDVILIDDIDTDQDCRNPEIIRQRWNWVEQALIGTRSVSNPMLIIFCGNIIAKHCCITEAIKKADHVDVINIRGTNGKSSWPEKNTEAQIDRVLSKISYLSAQKEYFNNPVDEGSVFKEMAYKGLPALNEYQFLVCYTDPSFKDSKKNDFKATVLIGRWHDEFHVIKCFLDQTSTANMVEWHYYIMDFVGDKVPVYYYMEKVFIQDILMDEFNKIGKQKGRIIPIKGDERAKPDKFTRIESLLEPLNRNGNFFLNDAEKDNPNMQRLEDQFKALAPGSRAHDDGPDAVEGAVWIINNKIREMQPIILGKRKHSLKRF